MSSNRVVAFSTVAALVSLGAVSAIFGACSTSATNNDAGEAGPVCDPKSTDPAGCPCDPSTTQTADCYTGPAGTNGKGICKTGKRSCTPEGTFTVCEGEVTPQVETCNYTDDDCNGIADDLPEIADAAVIANCNSPACDPDFSDAAITCWGPDPGICGAGTKACKSGPTGGSPTGCNEFIHGGVPEMCNGIDDDCNGAIDDGLDTEGPCDMANGAMWAPDANPFDGGAPTKILGECVHGNLTCVDTNCTEHSCEDAGDQCYPSQPTTESCDGLDNDCNGKIDDHACAGQGQLKYCCNDGMSFYECDNQADEQFWDSCVLAN